MSRFIFLRHGHSAANAAGLLTGQLPGVGLSPQGVKDARKLVGRIGPKVIDHLYISPIERCQLTIDPWLRSKNSSSLRSMEIVDGFSEIDFGRWSGRKLSALRRDPLWRDIQKHPSRVTFPDGESFRRAQNRAVASLREILDRPGNRTHLIVSHSDTIKLVASQLLGMKLDEFQKLTINPASFTIFNGKGDNLNLMTINSSSSLAEILSS